MNSRHYDGSYGEGLTPIEEAMKFLCANCNRRMKFQEATGSGGGGMSVVSVCANCRNRIVFLANPGETLLLQALNAGPSGAAFLDELLDSATETLALAGRQGAESSSTPATQGDGATWREKAEEWVWVEPGRFLMGSPEAEPGREPDEDPQHEVVISRGFYLGKYPITQGQWQEVMGTAPWSGRGRVPSSPTRSAVFISWNDVHDFVFRLNGAGDESLYRLPSEAEWEYACRAGTVTAWSFGDDRHDLGAHTTYVDSDGQSEAQSPPEVGTKLPNPWGLCDMHGNVWEWCRDVYGDHYYADSPAVDPTGPEAGRDSPRVVRGGYFRYFPRHSRSAARNTRWPGDQHRALGARLVKTVPS